MFSASNYFKQNLPPTPPPKKKNIYHTRKHSFDSGHAEQVSGIRPAMVPPHVNPEGCLVAILHSTKNADYEKLG